MDKKPSELNSDDIQELKSDFLDNITTNAALLIDNALGTFEILKMLLEELEKDKNIQEQLASMETMQEALKSEALNILYDRVAQRLSKEHPEIKEDAAEIVADTANVIIKKSPNFKMNIDKFNNVFFSSILPPLDCPDGQESFIPLKYEKDGSDKQITLYYSYSFDDELFKKCNLQKNFTDYDMFVMSAVDNLKASGNDIITPTLIAKELGYGEKPSKAQVQDILDSCIKQMGTTLIIKDGELVKAWQGDKALPKKKERKIISHLIDAKIADGGFYINGKYVESAILVYDISPMARVAQVTGQITTFPKSLLTNNIRKDKKTYFPILHYLIGYISRYKRNPTKMHNKILYDTLYKTIGAKTYKQQSAAQKKLYEILDHFKTVGFISGYKEEATKSTGKIGVIFYVEPVKKISAKKG